MEAKESTVGTEEPIKSEAPIQSPNSSDRSDGAASPPPNCSICLGKMVNTSFTDSCLHQFCFTCLLQWSKIKTECPLCKQTFKSIIHNVRSEEDYDQYHVPRELASQIQQPPVQAFDPNLELDEELDFEIRRYLYRTTMTVNRRHAAAYNAEQVARREQLQSMVPRPREARRRRRVNPAISRTVNRYNVYRTGIWSNALPGVYGRFEGCSADHYRREPWDLDRLIPWLNRDLQVLLNNNASHIAYVMRIILGALSQYDIRSAEFRDLVRPYFGIRTDHFVHELLNFAVTNFDLAEYDRTVTYVTEGMSNQYSFNVVSPASSRNSVNSDDSDVRVLDEAIDLRVNTELPGIGPHQIGMPGPSTVGQAFQVNSPHYNESDILTISSDSSGSRDECEVIGYVKPRHRRTPEIIELVSSDPEEISTHSPPKENIQAPCEPVRFGDGSGPSTSHTVKKVLPPSSPNSDSDSDGDYDRRSRKYENRTKKSSRRSVTKRRDRSMEIRNHGRRSKSYQSSSEESESRRRRSRRSVVRSIKVRVSSSSDCSCHENESKKNEDRRCRRNSARGIVRVRRDLIKRKDRYTSDESSSSSNKSETDDNAKSNKSRVSRSKRKYVSSSSDFETARSERITRTRNKERQMTDVASVSKKSDIKDEKCEEGRQSRSRSSSTSSYSSQREKRINSRKRGTSECRSNDERYSTKNLWRKDRESKSKSKSKSKGRRIIRSSSDTDGDCFRSNSQCSNHSNKSHGHWKKSKHKTKHRSKERKRSNSRTNSSLQLDVNGASVGISTLIKNEPHSTSKHSDSKSSSNSKERRKSHKSHKESKHKGSQIESKLKSKKKRRRIRVCSSSNSE